MTSTATEATPAATSATGSGIEVHNPATGALIGSIPNQSREEIEAMAAELRAAQPEWEALGYKGRGRWLERWRDWLLDNDERLNRMLQDESGKSQADSIELPIAYDVINYYVKHGKRFLKPERRRPHSAAMRVKKLSVQWRPYPLVGLITPWNGPIGNPMLDLPPALVAGCAVLTKPSEFTPLVWEECVRGWRDEIGAPPVLSVAQGAGETGAAVVDTVDMVHFTGSARTGRKIAARCGERLIPCSLELGGKDPMIVLADADIERAANAAVWGGFHNSGQICISTERVYVEEPVYDEFVELVTEKVSRLRLGQDMFGTPIAVDTGAMANEAQMAIVKRHVDDAVQKGAKALTGGKPREGEGLFFEPTVLVDVDHSMACMREETFGPTLPIMKVSDSEEALGLANDSDYGLSSSLFTKSRSRAKAVAPRIESGAVNVNDVFMNVFNVALPMGGWNDSGMGARSGAEGIRKYCRRKAVVKDRLGQKSEMHWYPATDKKAAMQAKATRFMGARDWRRRLGRTPRD